MFDPFNANLRIYHAAEHRCSPSWSWDSDRNHSTRLHLWFIADGRGQLEAPDCTYQLRRGECFILRLRERHFGSNDPNHPLIVPAFDFDVFDDDGNVCQPSKADLPRHRRLRDIAFFHNCILRTVRARSTGKRELAVHWLRTCLQLIMEEDAVAREDEITGPLSEPIGRICRLIEADPTKQYSMSDLAAMVPCSKEHFIRSFRQCTGVTPGEFQICARIERAKELLRFSSSSINSIAESLGYRDPYYFSRQFKQQTGATPSSYRRGMGE